ncbi:MAG: hypothetical protein LBL47_04870 [Lactobacillus sp.]|jgi:hypothetical protein|nr:hypothetical protein [Lactobacillus sp.]
MFNRKYEGCSADLAERIISRSYHIKQKQSLYQNMLSFFSDLSLPKPAFVMPTLFLAGFLISFNIGNITDVTDYIDSMYLSL